VRCVSSRLSSRDSPGGPPRHARGVAARLHGLEAPLPRPRPRVPAGQVPCADAARSEPRRPVRSVRPQRPPRHPPTRAERQPLRGLFVHEQVQASVASWGRSPCLHWRTPPPHASATLGSMHATICILICRARLVLLWSKSLFSAAFCPLLVSERWDLGVGAAATARAARAAGQRRVAYLVGSTCRPKAQLYHAGWHFKFRLFARVRRRLHTVRAPKLESSLKETNKMAARTCITLFVSSSVASALFFCALLDYEKGIRGVCRRHGGGCGWRMARETVQAPESAPEKGSEARRPYPRLARAHTHTSTAGVTRARASPS
jgi:hypothetical protein